MDINESHAVRQLLGVGRKPGLRSEETDLQAAPP